MKYLVNTVVGAVIWLLGLLLVTGPQAFGLILLLAVMCTAGVILIPFVFLSYFLGRLVTSFFSSAKKDSVATINPLPESQWDDVDSLARYLRKAKAQGKGDGEITRILSDAGWTSNEIQQAQQVLARS